MSAHRVHPGVGIATAARLIAAARRGRAPAPPPPAKLRGPYAKRKAEQQHAAELRQRAHRSIMRKP